MLIHKTIQILMPLIKDMSDLNTQYMIDRLGTVWEFGTFYSQPLHFRTGFGHWSEMILEEWMFETRGPFCAYVDCCKPEDKDF